ncbi:predicted protein [Paecilomyces variotii No. 5]|uniref:Uncharacterized protein n=1 Tax=Byssochlamys spectabilis (strain No. 5 / NBRC 109023) TaxID=1356009 RepID=V5FZE4_BYSSN|nr:predicted protein [Paecilomyces variotii No. 5]
MNEKKADSVLTVLLNAESVNIYTEKELNDIIGAKGWTTYITEAVLDRMVHVLKAGISMGPAMEDALEKATYEAAEFSREHPEYLVVIALGIMTILMPWCLEVLGFAELGPIEGTFAAWWQARYAGYVPKNSLFSYFQRLGMIWKH